ncbi:MAG: BatA domain-containing protein [Candidatus Binatus sp.]|uniref:BatA domain-containing protein n=2 Tax=Candidatus Binatus sp. TaxID=2811406 RepID=UPI003BAE545C
MGFLNPQNIIYGLSLALLVLIYLRSRSRPTIEVSSLMLFDEAPAPVASVRQVRLDPLFWLEMATLAALTLAIAGLYVMRPPSPGHGRSHALVFDLGAGMSAHDGSSTRIDEARRAALEIINQAPVGDEFSVIAYALEAQVRHPQTANRADLRKALDDLVPMAVPARTAALRAALIRAHGASEIDLFADRPPAPAILADAASTARVNFHQVGSGDSNLAIVSLDPGIPGSTRGRTVIRNFSARPHPAELAIDLGDAEEFHQTMMLAPREQILASFGPLKTGGLLHARILTADAIDADNSRYAYAPSDVAARVLVLSPDAAVRDDIARVLLAVNSNFQIETADPSKYVPQSNAAAANAKPLELAVMHDCYLPAVKAASTLLIYPPDATKSSPYAAGVGISVSGTIANADIRNDSMGQSPATESLTLGATRIVAIPEWMDLIATAAGPGHPSIPIAAIGRATSGPVGVLAFDVRDHLLLAPDHLDALVLTVDLMKQLTAPRDIFIVATGSDVSVPAYGTARVTQPDASVRTIAADKWGRVRIRPLQAGRYTVESGGVTTQVLANYYDAAESDIAAKPQAKVSAPVGKAAALANAQTARQVQPLVFILIALALIALMVESAMLINHAGRWRMRHV